jgi:hypothetical protein
VTQFPNPPQHPTAALYKIKGVHLLLPLDRDRQCCYAFSTETIDNIFDLAMDTQLRFDILTQPDDITCGPTCLHAVYNYYNDKISLKQVIRQVNNSKGGGHWPFCWAVTPCARGYRAKLYTFNLQVFDPTWFKLDKAGMQERLARQMRVKSDAKMRAATHAYLEFLRLGGTIRFEDLTASLIRGLLKRSVPILTGLSATFLYRTAREIEVGREMHFDDIKGEPTGHFVVLCGYDMGRPHRPGGRPAAAQPDQRQPDLPGAPQSAGVCHYAGHFDLRCQFADRDTEQGR